jgi:hypothetical protein
MIRMIIGWTMILEIMVIMVIREIIVQTVVAEYERLRGMQREAERQAEGLFQSLLTQAFGGD